jgi:hypothetical protein
MKYANEKGSDAMIYCIYQVSYKQRFNVKATWMECVEWTMCYMWTNLRNRG